MNGLIALDIDGTLTSHDHHIDQDVADYLATLKKEGWTILLATGRSLAFAEGSFDRLKFPFHVALQNGADLLKMPEKENLLQLYLDSTICKKLDEFYKTIPEDYIIYSGHETGDFCFYRKKNFTPSCLDYLSKLQRLTPVDWKDVESFEACGQETFPLIKCFGKEIEMLGLHAHLDKMPEIQVARIRDPIDPTLTLLLITAADVNKGTALKHFAKLKKITGPIIAAGDDLNDVPLLQAANIKIAMGTGPKELTDMADIIAKSSKEQGIIPALQEAVASL